jgi:RNA polymerase sigma-70 factor (ECF subfamily)
MAQRRRVPEGGDDVSGRAAMTARPDVTLDLEAAIAALPTQARHVFVLRAIYGYSHDDVAESLDIAVGTARAHYFRARDALRRVLDLEDGDE